MEREKRIKSGKLLEVDFFPITENGKKLPTRATKSKPSTEAQQKYNQICSVKKLVRLVNTNFSEGDYFMHPTYRDGESPQDETEARRDIGNFMRRVKRRRDAELRRKVKALAEAEKASAVMPENAFLRKTVDGLKSEIKKLSEPMKYIYAIEAIERKTGKYAGKKEYHFHLFVTGGISSAEMEEMWKLGGANCRRYQPEKFGAESAAKYMGKDPQGRKRFAYSRSIEQPKTAVRDGKVSRGLVEKMARERIDDREYWEKRYKGYRFLRCYARLNPYNGRWYVSVVMYKNGEELPEWGANEWLTEDY